MDTNNSQNSQNLEKEKMAQYNKTYYETHKEEYKNKYNRKIVCDVCKNGKEYGILNWANHTKTQKHKQNAQGIISKPKSQLIKEYDSITTDLLKRVLELESKINN